MWVNVIQCPTGSCGTSNPPFIKMPRFTMLASGPQVDYTRVACYTTSGALVKEATQVTNPRGGTAGNHCDPPSRDSVRIFGSPTIDRDLKIIGRSYPGSFSIGGSGSPWEAASGTTPSQGLDRWAYMPLIDSRPSLPAGGGSCPNFAGPITRSWQQSARNWEMAGDDGTHLVYSDGNKGYRWPTKGVFLKGWEDGSNHDGCQSLFNRFGPAGESFATYIAIRAE
jgi:hypothetical protein